jgi:hypothetical protein
MARSAEDEAFAAAWFLARVEREPRHRNAETDDAVRPPSRDAARDPECAWIPERCSERHWLGPGTVTFSFVMCRDCPATRDGRGHHIARCRVLGCTSPDCTPPGHVGPIQLQH